MSESSFTHIALSVGDLEASVDFYRRYAELELVHERREPSGARTVWMSDGKLPFVLVLIAPGRASVRRSLGRVLARWFRVFAHLGVSCDSREKVESLCELALREGRLRKPPRDAGPIVGYYGMIADPDGHNLEVSFGQVVAPPTASRTGHQ
jgi:catechol 2,3-dioxygenase-like lactoylglutathione lyase family enzyme